MIVKISILIIYLGLTFYAPCELTRIILSYIKHGYAQEFGVFQAEIALMWGFYLLSVVLVIYLIHKLNIKSIWR